MGEDLALEGDLGLRADLGHHVAALLSQSGLGHGLGLGGALLGLSALLLLIIGLTFDLMLALCLHL